MIWTISEIEKIEYDDDRELLPGEPERLLVCVESEDGRFLQFEVAENWLLMQELEIGDEWPEKIDEEGEEEMDRYLRQSQWMDDYMQALEDSVS